MSKYIKDLVRDELKDRYAELDNALWVEFVGVDGHLTNDFRHELRGKDMRIEIVKNSLFRRAVEGSALAPIGDRLDGPSAVLTGGESVIDIAKVLDDWIRKLKGLKLKGAVLDGEYIGEDRIDQLSKMPTRADMQAKLVACVLAPGANLAAVALSGGSNIAGCLKAMIGKLEDGETIAKKSA